MDLIVGYSDEEGGGRSPAPAAEPVRVLALGGVSGAPEVDTAGLQLVENKAVSLGEALHLQPAAARLVKYNLPVEQMHAPVVGPLHHNQRDPLAGMRNHRSGHVEDANLSTWAFEEQFNIFNTRGVAADPGGAGTVQRHDKYVQGLAPEGEGSNAQAPKRQRVDNQAARQQQQEQQQQFDPSQPFRLVTRQPWAEKESVAVGLSEEEQAELAQYKAEKAALKGGEEGKKVAESTVFHGKAEKDFQGRSWMAAPKERRREAEACFLPKRHIHTWSGHSKGVNAIRFFPVTGHLLLSAGLDGQVKIWDVYNDKKCVRTYMGHSKGIRDIWFANDGRHFLSAGYDKKIHYWDTETGQVVSTLAQGKMCYCVRLHPEEQNMVLAGTQEKKIIQWDLNTGEQVQEYDYHLSSVNTVTFIDKARRFVTTSDDKTIRMWEYGIQAQAKYIADPAFHAIASAAVSPNEKWWVGQSMDNQIVTYSADRMKPNRKKTFKGHLVAGYACQVGFSWDSKYVISGDGEGKLFIWDWKTTKILRSLKAHDQVCMGCEWHPLETSKVATCSWDGLIKYWD